MQMNSRAGAESNLEATLSEAAKLLPVQPGVAAEKAAAILSSFPDYAPAKLLLGVAQRKAGQVPAAIATLESLVRAHPDWVPGCYQLGTTLAGVGRTADALSILNRAVRLRPDFGEGWGLIADCLVRLGYPAAADRAYANQLVVSAGGPELSAPAAAFCQDRFSDAESLLRSHVEQRPDDHAALRMLAEVLSQLGRPAEAELLLNRCLELDPGSAAARSSLATALYSMDKTKESLAQVEQLLATDPKNPRYLNLKANVLVSLGQYEQASVVFADLLAGGAVSPRVWIAYGDVLKTVGRQAESVEAYGRAIELAPSLGEAYWSLANLKTYRFVPEEVEAMRRHLAAGSLSDRDRIQFCFALGKALEDAGQYEESFAQYVEGNRLRRYGIKYDPEETSAYVRRSKGLLTEDFFRQRTDWGCPGSGPIFVIGMPRSGSTLVEQILCSHSGVEGTKELTEVTKIARALVEATGTRDPSLYPGVISTLSADDLRSLGENYLEQTRIHRRSGLPHFVDKMPNNWTHVGLIHLMLPQAKIVDVRRHPLACGLSLFKQYFARGQQFSYDLAELGCYYRDYVDLMTHFDEVLPGRVHRVFYEQLVEDTGSEVGRLLEYCGLAYEESCLRFFENERPVPTPSAEQVRQPIFDEALEHWRHYDPWLGPLKEALGPVLETYPV